MSSQVQICEKMRPQMIVELKSCDFCYCHCFCCRKFEAFLSKLKINLCRLQESIPLSWNEKHSKNEKFNFDFFSFQVPRKETFERHASGAPRAWADQGKLDFEGADQGSVWQLWNPRRGDPLWRRRRQNFGVDAVERTDLGVRQSIVFVLTTRHVWLWSRHPRLAVQRPRPRRRRPDPDQATEARDSWHSSGLAGQVVISLTSG